MESVVLNWQGPYTFVEVLSDKTRYKQFDCPGVYLWKELGSMQNRITYVGKATGSPSLSKRQLQHYMSYIGGCYFIPAAYRDSGRAWSLDVSDTEVIETITDQSSFLALISDCFRYVERIAIFLAINSEENLAPVERNLLFNIKPEDTNWGTQSPPANRITVINRGAISQINEGIPEEKRIHEVYS